MITVEVNCRAERIRSRPSQLLLVDYEHQDRSNEYRQYDVLEKNFGSYKPKNDVTYNPRALFLDIGIRRA